MLLNLILVYGYLRKRILVGNCKIRPEGYVTNGIGALSSNIVC